MSKIFSFCNQKGGVGKTTSAINIATIAAQSGFDVLLLDLDSQGNATSGLGIDKESLELTTYQLLVDKSIDIDQTTIQTDIPRLSLVPSNTDLAAADIELVALVGREFVLKNKLAKVADKYDFIIIDCPPSLGLLSVNALTASDYIIIPMQCEYYALEGLGQLLTTHQLVQKNLNLNLEVGGVILTMADSRTNLTQQVIEEVRGFFKEKAFKTIIPRAVKLSEAPSFGKPAVIYDPQNRGSKAYADLGKEFVSRFSPASKKAMRAAVSESEQPAPTTQAGETVSSEP